MTDLTRLCRDLGLPPGDAFTQDWAYELPAAYRTRTWLDKYLAAHLHGGYAAQEQHALMRLLLDVSNDLLSAEVSAADPAIANTLAAL